MNACESIQSELSAYLDGELQAAERAACEAHMRACPTCRAVLEDLQAACAAVSGLPSLKAPPALAERIHQDVSLKPPPPNLARFDKPPAPLPAMDYSPWTPVLVGIAALVILCTMAFLMLPALSVPRKFRTAALSEPSKAALARRPAARNDLRLEKKAEVPADTVAAANPATEAPARAEEGAVRFKGEAAPEERTAGEKQGMKQPVAAASTPPPPPAVAAPVAPSTAQQASAPGMALGANTTRRRATSEREELVVEEPLRKSLPSSDKAGALKEKAARPFEEVDKRAPDVAVTMPGVPPSQGPALPRTPALNKTGTLADAGKKMSDGAADKEEAVASESKKIGAPKPDGLAGKAGFNSNLEAAKELAVEKPAAQDPQLREMKEQIVTRQKAEGALATKQLATKTETGAKSEPKSRGAFGQGKGGGGASGAAFGWSAPQEVLVFRTQDPERLMAQLRELAAQNGARWEGAELAGGRKPGQAGLGMKDGEPRSNAPVAQSPAPLAGGGRAKGTEYVDCAILASGQQYRDVLAKLHDLQGLSLRGREEQLQRGAEQGRAQSSGVLQAQETKPSAQKELDQAEAGQSQSEISREAHAAPSAAPPAKPQQTGQPEARIEIRIEIIPAK